MNQVQVKITGQAITARYGTLSTGDMLVTDAAFAKHLVEDCGAAEYVKKAPAAAPAKQETTAATKPAAAKVKATVATKPTAAAPGDGGGATPPGGAPDETAGAQPPVAPETSGDMQTSAQSTDAP